MTTAADQLDDTPSPTDLQQFVYLANNVSELLATAKRELERDREAAKASLTSASSILHSEIERCSHAKSARPGAFAAWKIGPFELSSRERSLRRDGAILPLGDRAFDILVCLAERPGEVISKQELLDRVWSDVTVEEGSLRVHVAAIRKVLGDDQFGNRYIANIKGRGYSFVGTIVRLAEREPSSTQRSRILTTAVDHLDDAPSPTDAQQFVDLANNVFELLAAARREIERDREAAKASLTTASSILQSEIERSSRANSVRPGALAAWQIACVRAFIDENLHRTIHAKDLSAVAQRSTSHFSRSFKQAFGEPPHAYVVRRRLERACHLMITSSASLSEIALSVGFSDQTHLSRLFRRAFGQSPSSWRRYLENWREPI